METRATIALLPEAARAVSGVADRIDDDAWDNATPCTDWSVYDVLNHLTCEHLWAPHLLRGESLEEVGDRYDGDVLGAERASSWRRAVAASMMAFGRAEPERLVATSMGPLPVWEYANQMLLDLTVHGWDLSQGAGVAYQPVPDAVEAVWSYAKPRVDRGQDTAVFARPVATESTDRLDQLVALLGRDPGWDREG